MHNQYIYVEGQGLLSAEKFWERHMQILASQALKSIIAENPLNTEFISPREVAKLLGSPVQTVYNYVYKKIFIQGLHYSKPTKGKLIFSRSAIVDWIENRDVTAEKKDHPIVHYDNVQAENKKPHFQLNKRKNRDYINI